MILIPTVLLQLIVSGLHCTQGRVCFQMVLVIQLLKSLYIVGLLSFFPPITNKTEFCGFGASLLAGI